MEALDSSILSNRDLNHFVKDKNAGDKIPARAVVEEQEEVVFIVEKGDRLLIPKKLEEERYWEEGGRVFVTKSVNQSARRLEQGLRARNGEHSVSSSSSSLSWLDCLMTEEGISSSDVMDMGDVEEGKESSTHGTTIAPTTTAAAEAVSITTESSPREVSSDVTTRAMAMPDDDNDNPVNRSHSSPTGSNLDGRTGAMEMASEESIGNHDENEARVSRRSRRRQRNSNSETEEEIARRQLRRELQRRTMLTWLCIPCMCLLTLFVLLMIMIFMGLPFCMLLFCLLSAYYCCTSDPLPPRVLLRVLMDTDDWNNNNNDGYGNNSAAMRRFFSKRDIEDALVQRICLGCVTILPTVGDNETSTSADSVPKEIADMIGQDLQTVGPRHDGRVHWRYEGEDIGHADLAGKCLVFSEFLSHSNRADIDLQIGQFRQQQQLLLQQQRKAPKGTQVSPCCFSNHRLGDDDDSYVDVEQGSSSSSPSLSNCACNKDNGVDMAEPKQEEEDEDVVDLASVRERGTCCDICLIHFESGDVVAWSTNPQCDHAYHSACISDWLMRQPTCPSCRQEYLPITPETQPDAVTLGDENSINPVVRVSDLGDSDANIITPSVSSVTSLSELSMIGTDVTARRTHSNNLELNTVSSLLSTPNSDSDR